MKAFVGGAVVALTLGVASYAVAHHEKGHEGGGGAGKVTICHFPGHEGDFQTDAKKGCDKSGGVQIEIACTAAVNGHGVKTKCGGGLEK